MYIYIYIYIYTHTYIYIYILCAVRKEYIVVHIMSCHVISYDISIIN